MKKTVYAVLLVFFVGLLCYSVLDLLDIFGSYRQGQESYQHLEQYVSFEPTEPAEAVIPETETAMESAEETRPEATEPPELAGLPRVDFEHLSQINPDVVGWIYIRDTNINYPIVQGSNNKYYLDKLFDGTYNAAGSIFLDAACFPDFSGNHSIIYGHNMKDKSMFADLMKYKDQIFFEEHSEGLLITPTAVHKIVFFSGYVSHNWTDAWELEFRDVSFSKWLKNIEARSFFDTTDYPGEDDRILTLSTCTYEFDDAKYVLHGYVTETIEYANPVG